MQVQLPRISVTRTQHEGPQGKHPWVYRASVAQIVTVSVLLGVIVWVLISGLDLFFAVYPNLMAIPTATVDVLVAFAIGALVMKLLLAQQAQHRRIVTRLRMIAEMNHHARNALEEIELTAYASQNHQFVEDIRGATMRIQWALSEILPIEDDDAD